MDKKGAEMTIGTIIIIILALVVLVVIIYGFTTGWGNLWQKITGFSPKANIQTNVQACQVACASEAKADYCKMRKIYSTDTDKTGRDMSCKDIENANVGLEVCNAISCTATSGVCDGLAVSTKCSDMNDKSETVCKNVAPNACVWQGTNTADPNKGTCTLKQTLKCADYNGQEANCIAVGCTWTAI